MSFLVFDKTLILCKHFFEILGNFEILKKHLGIFLDVLLNGVRFMVPVDDFLEHFQLKNIKCNFVFVKNTDFVLYEVLQIHQRLLLFFELRHQHRRLKQLTRRHWGFFILKLNWRNMLIFLPE